MDKVYFIKLLVLLAAFFCCRDISAQNPDEPDVPVLESVSVDPNTGLVTIKWYPENPPVSVISTDGYIIYWHREYPSRSNYPIDTIWDPAARSYTFHPDHVSTSPPMPDPRKTTVSYAVATVHRSPLKWSTRSDEDYVVQVSSRYDSCRAEIRLNWHPYTGWYANREPYKALISYRVMQIPDGGGVPVEVKRLSDQDTAFTVTRVEENKHYVFYVEAERSDGFTVTSYKTEKTTTMPISPAFVLAEGTQYDGQELAGISFKIDPNAQTYSYEFLGSSKPDYSFVPLGTIDIHNDTVLTDMQARGKTFYYKLAAWHTCKNKYVAESNVATALWLTLKQDDQSNSLQWDPYKDWGGEAKYEVHRQIGTNNDTIIATLTDPGQPAYKDDLSGVKIDGDICYRIIAMPVSAGSTGRLAISNSVCIKPESDIFVPKAFTPNGDGLNDVFMPSFSYPPQDYIFFVYDRNGARVFQTQNLGEGWDGRLKNGKPANEGVYGYYLRFKTARGRLVEKRGTFSLVLPR